MNPPKRPLILLVEDDENDVFFFERAARKALVEAEIRVVTDGEAAVDHLLGTGACADRSAHPMPDLTVLDLNLPRLHGLQVLKAVRAHAALAAHPIVVLSSSGADRDIAEALGSGANSYFVKPRKPDDLVRLLALLDDYWFKTGKLPAKPRGPLGR